MAATSGRRPALPATIALHAVAIGLSILFLMPLLWMLKTSLMEAAQAKSIPPVWWPNPFRWDNYRTATQQIPFWTYALNTVKISLLNVIGTTASCSLAAWGFAHYRFPGRNFFFGATLATMMVPFPVLMVPQYAIFKELEWIGTSKPLWAPAFFASAYNIFLLRQFFLTVPRDLTDVARLDGCGEFRIFLQVVVPLCKPAILVVALFCLLYNWNDFMGPLIYLTDESQFTLALGLQAFQSRLGETEITYLMAATALMILPVIVLFFLAQKTFVESVSLTGLKG